MLQKANVLPISEYQQASTRGPTRNAQTGPIHPDPDRVGGQVAVHLANGAWEFARQSLDAALEEAKRHAAESKAARGPLSCSQLAIPDRLVNLLERNGVLWADDLARMSEDELLGIPHLGKRQLATIWVALQNAGLRRTA